MHLRVHAENPADLDTLERALRASLGVLRVASISEAGLASVLYDDRLTTEKRIVGAALDSGVEVEPVLRDRWP